MASEKIIKQKEAEIKELAEQFKSDKLILLVCLLYTSPSPRD